MMIIVKVIFRFLIITACILFFLTGGLRIAMLLLTQDSVYNLDTVPSKAVVLVPGAGLNAVGGPSLPLRDRLDAAIQLYKAGKVQKLLVSGDNDSVYYNEPGAMQTYAIEAGIPEEDVVPDYAGRRTYDSCYRARHIFGMDELIVVTQAYHLPRAVFLCENSGIDVVGVPVEQSRYIRSRFLFWNVREVFASIIAWTDVLITKPLPILGEFEPIFP
jgi:SanA protein